MLDRALMLLAAVAYVLAVAIFVVYTRKKIRAPEWPMVGLVGLGFVLHSAGLYLRGMERGSCPITNPYEVFQFISWSIVLVFLLTGPVFRTSFLGVFTAGLAAVLALVPSLFPALDALSKGPSFGGNPWVETHAALSIFSYGVFGLLAATSVMYLLQHRSLRARKYGLVARFLPPIVQLDHVNLRLLLIGTGFFSVSLGIGVVYWMLNPDVVPGLKLVAAFSVWIAYLVAILLRWRRGLHGPRLAWSAVGLFAFALLVLWPVELSRNTERSVLSYPVFLQE